MTKDFYIAMKERRSIYAIGKEKIVSDAKIEEVIKEAVKYAPSAFNSQSARIIILFDGKHDKLWNITKDALRKIVPADKFKPTEDKINSFRAGYGTVLFFEDMSVVESMQKQFPSYSHNFPIWSHHSSGINQYLVWTSLEAEGLGASLQHYNELIEAEVAKEWNVAKSWKLIAQMPFGKPLAPAGEKEFMPLDQRVKSFK